MKRFRYLEGVTTLALDAKRCVGCGRCLEVCPHGVFSRADDKVGIQDRDACIECGACALNCPVQAISVTVGVGCATGIMNRWLRKNRLPFSSGDCCS